MYAGRIVESGGVREIFTEPAHPYTRALLKSIPDVDSKVDRLASIKGEPPSLYNLPEGCYFSPRCTEPKDICFREYPRTMQVGPGHFVNCWQVR